MSNKSVANNKANNDDNVVDILAKLVARTQKHKESIPQSDLGGGAYWNGVSFSLNSVDYLAPLDEITEIISVPETTKVPGTRSWLKGVANLRGVLLTLIDLQEFLGRSTSRNVLKQRVLVIDQKGSYLGLIVDEVTGMQHFEKNELVKKNLTADAAVAPFIVGAFSREQELWRIFGMKELSESAELHQIAV